MRQEAEDGHFLILLLLRLFMGAYTASDSSAPNLQTQTAPETDEHPLDTPSAKEGSQWRWSLLAQCLKQDCSAIALLGRGTLGQLTDRYRLKWLQLFRVA
ncbi:hypothetical protein SKAU_G00076910 [Synaphobranchus kaupii]|uniref:Secreted protein n=1 Tax=Synaphobranchus kaupii TaxID=118154 RepID=A0A9Q1G8C8_SYNKA|nr:hypothetical protein SKAU_G00076910 [Synaphobranchus kaupii]